MASADKSVAIINSKSFGKVTDSYSRLKRIFRSVKFMMLPPDIDGERLAQETAEYDFLVISGTPQFTESFFENNERVVAVVRHGIGVDNVDLSAATRCGVVVIKVPGYYERNAVAEFTIALMLSSLRRIFEAGQALKRGSWSERTKFVGSELTGKTVGVIGFGNIGRRVAEILIKGFGSRVLVYDPYVSPGEVESCGAEARGLDVLLRESDIITLHCPLTSQTRHLLDESAFRKMKDGVIVINTARGPIIDTSALVDALRSGKVAYAGLDVFEEEPLPPDHDILKLENVLATPHIAAYTLEALKGMDEYIVEALEKLLKGEIPLEGVANMEVLERNPRIKRLG